jgi:hypothetical protein
VPHRHAVGAYEGETLLGLEPRRLKASRRERLRAGHSASFVIGLAAPDEDLPDLSHLGQVGLSHRTPEPNHGVYSGVQRIDECPHQLHPHPHAALRHSVGPCDHHRPHDLG